MCCRGTPEFVEIRTRDPFFPFSLHPVCWAFTLRVHFILFHFIFIKGSMCVLTFEGGRSTLPGLLLPALHRALPAGSAGAGAPQVGPHGCRCAPGGRVPSPRQVDPPPLHLLSSSGLHGTPTQQPCGWTGEACMASEHFRPEAGCTSRLSENQQGEIALFLFIAEKAKA